MSGIPKIYNGKPLIHAWPYRDSQGQIIGIVGRYQDGSGKKDIVPFFKRSGSGWAAGAPDDPRPLFGLDRLAKQPKNKAIILPEGEKSAAAGQGLGICAVTSLGGANAANNTDWTPFNGFKTVYLLPDNDKPGEHYAQTAYRALMALDSPPTVKIIRLEGLPDGGDIVDWLQNHAPDWDGYAPFPADSTAWAVAELKTKLKTAEPVPDSWRVADENINVPEWEAPTPISITLKPVQAFDGTMLPDAFAVWVQDIARRQASPVDYGAIGAMVALSSVIGKKGAVQPNKCSDWIVVPNLWGLAIGRASAKKSPALSEVLKPLDRLEIDGKQQFDAEKSRNDAELMTAKIIRDIAEKDAIDLLKKKDNKAENRAVAEILLRESADSMANIQAPTRRRFKVNDVTIEKLGELLNENPNGLLLYRDEIAGFLKTIDREDRANDRAFYLECFDGKGRYTFDRIGRGTIDIESTCVALLGGIQPTRLQGYLHHAMNGGSGDDGFIQRFQLMVYPDLTKDHPIDTYPDTQAKNAAYAVFDRLAVWEGFGDNPARFAPDAQAVFDDWYLDLFDRQRADDIHPAIESHLGKFNSLVPSLAVIIHLADDSTHNDRISLKSLLKAIAFSGYLESHAMRIYGSAIDPIEAHASTILKKIQSGHLQDKFTPREIKQGGWTGLDTMDTINDALAVLVELGYLRPFITKKPSGGRTSKKFLIHPEIAKAPK
ncbi:YfjI family protein [Methylovulum psychrotolerans]|uniref:DUF3987 domain-containing protein n=1 Tax=Methylovulum psychrotolerans TaxID=1704499 RepID=A0A2S5CRE5_9GAMM|nr:YfjI family protein [Methylovulum psychrotolerans]POZ53373.1 hypothetical protein AADEFJLK_00393 [Methylovulum psychrotolerans]